MSVADKEKMMNFILRIIKKSFLWTYARNTWQWDVLCVLILAFIFLSPKSWFAHGERRPPAGHQTEAISTVTVSPEVIDNETDKAQLEEQIRAITGRANAQIVGVRRKHDEAGKTLGYEVDIR
jgi:hypothetical protein